MCKFWPGFFILFGFGPFSGNLFNCPSPQSQYVQARLIPEAESVQPGGSIVVGLWLEMEEGWHTYWKNPGDSGMQTRIEWDLPQGFVVNEIQWPCPERFEMAGSVSYGYEGEVVLLTEFEAPPTLRPDSKVEFLAHVEWLVCKDECIPGHEDLSLELLVRDRNPKKEMRWASLFDRTKKNLPQIFEDTKINAAFDKEKIYIQILPSESFRQRIKDIFFFPEQEGIIQYAEPQLLTEVQRGFVLELKRSKISMNIPSNLRGILHSPSGWDSTGRLKALQVDVPLAELEKSLKEITR